MTLKIKFFNLTRGYIYIYKVMKKKLVLMMLVEDIKLLQITHKKKFISLVHLTIQFIY
jgi:hypothetical protein